jgi:hypothetical protein
MQVWLCDDLCPAFHGSNVCIDDMLIVSMICNIQRSCTSVMNGKIAKYIICMGSSTQAKYSAHKFTIISMQKRTQSTLLLTLWCLSISKCVNDCYATVNLCGQSFNAKSNCTRFSAFSNFMNYGYTDCHLLFHQGCLRRPETRFV